MQSDIKWVALLDEDQDDFLIIQQGIHTWAPEIELRWFKNFPQFEQTLLAVSALPVLIILNGISPAGTEIEWLKRFKQDSRMARICIIILVEDYWEEQKKLYEAIPVENYMLKPVNHDELKRLIDQVRLLLGIPD